MGINKYRAVCNSTQWYVPICDSLSMYILVYTQICNVYTSIYNTSIQLVSVVYQNERYGCTAYPARSNQKNFVASRQYVYYSETLPYGALEYNDIVLLLLETCTYVRNSYIYIYIYIYQLYLKHKALAITLTTPLFICVSDV